MQVGWVNIGNFRQIAGYISNKVQDRRMVSIKVFHFFSLLAALALHLWSHLLAHPHHLLYELQIVPSSMLPLVSGINARLPSVNHALISPILPHPVV